MVSPKGLVTTYPLSAGQSAAVFAGTPLSQNRRKKPTGWPHLLEENHGAHAPFLLRGRLVTVYSKSRLEQQHCVVAQSHAAQPCETFPLAPI